MCEGFGKAPGDELVFCTNPDGSDLLNVGSVTVNKQGRDINLPKICGYVPPVKKDVVSEASQGVDMFAMHTASDGTLTIEATPAYLGLCRLTHPTNRHGVRMAGQACQSHRTA